MECVGMFVIGVCRLRGRLLSVACGMYRYAFYGCVSIAWVVAPTAYIHYISSLLLCSFALFLYSLLFYSIILPYGRLLVECVGLFFIGVCRLLGRLLSVACGMYRYAFYR